MWNLGPTRSEGDKVTLLTAVGNGTFIYLWRISRNTAVIHGVGPNSNPWVCKANDGRWWQPEQSSGQGVALVCLARVTKENFRKKLEVGELGGQRGAGPGAIPQVYFREGTG